MTTSDGGDPIPASGRVAGIDYGTVRIGIAITDPAQRISSPLENYNRKTKTLDERYFQELVHQERIVGWVVGLPVFTGGDESPKSREARRFGARLAELTVLPVRFFDERFTSAFAGEMLALAGLTSKKRKARMDKLAAQILLANWLESSRQGESAGPLDDSG